MNTFLRVTLVVLAVLAVIGIGAGVYQAGLSQGFAEAARQAAENGDQVVRPEYLGYGWHGYGFGHGVGFFGIIFWILGILLIIGLVRAAFGWGRWGGPGGPGGWGPGGRREHFEEIHREMHRREAPNGERAGA